MSRHGIGGSPACGSYSVQLREAIARFLPHQGLPLLQADRRVRFTPRMLALLAILMSWSPGGTLIDRFDQARTAVVAFYGTRRRPGRSPRSHSPARTLRVLRVALSGRRRRGKSLSRQLTLAVKDEYQRRADKRARNYPKKRPQRPPGKPEARMASAIEKRLIQRILAQPPPDSLAA